MKKCSKCKIHKDIFTFYKNKRSKDGRQGICKDCKKQYFIDNKIKNLKRIIKPGTTLKKCTKCQTEIGLDQFDINLRNPNGYDYWCRLCRRSYFKQNYADNLEKSRERTNVGRAKRIQWLTNIKKDTPCKDCGKIFDSFCMDFDHLFGKIKSVSRMLLENASKDSILEEIKKCDLVCVLCHNIRTNIRLVRCSEKKHTKYVARNITIINKAKNKPCKICGNQYSSYNMHFDHIDPSTKFKNISQLKSVTVKTLLLEMEKCQVLCALCHRRKSIIDQRLKKYKQRIVILKPKPFIDNVSKECIKCYNILPFNDFTKHKKTKSGLNSWCKNCFNTYRREKRRTFANSRASQKNGRNTK